VFNVLDVEDDGYGGEIQDGGPETEVASPDAAKVYNLEDSLEDGGGAKGGEDGQLCVKVPILLDGLGAAFLQEIVDCTGSKDETKGRDRGYPNIEEAGREIIAKRADGPPTFSIAA
jgi:hypothetical protein